MSRHTDPDFAPDAAAQEEYAAWSCTLDDAPPPAEPDPPPGDAGGEAMPR